MKMPKFNSKKWLKKFNSKGWLKIIDEKLFLIQDPNQKLVTRSNPKSLLK